MLQAERRATPHPTLGGPQQAQQEQGLRSRKCRSGISYVIEDDETIGDSSRLVRLDVARVLHLGILNRPVVLTHPSTGSRSRSQIHIRKLVRKLRQSIKGRVVLGSIFLLRSSPFIHNDGVQHLLLDHSFRQQLRAQRLARLRERWRALAGGPALGRRRREADRVSPKMSSLKNALWSSVLDVTRNEAASTVVDGQPQALEDLEVHDVSELVGQRAERGTGGLLRPPRRALRDC